MAVIPSGYNTGTVFLNGWKFVYGNGDHHVQGLGTAIFNIAQVQNGEQQELHWEVVGVLSDDNGDDPYDWCYTYTLLFWHRNQFDWQLIPPQVAALPVDSDADPDILTFVHETVSDPGNDTARRELSGAVTVYAPPLAVLPRGFGLGWTETDHHVLQVGFDLGTPTLNGDTISWTSSTLLKDNSDRHDYRGSEIVSVLGGPSIQMWHPDTVYRCEDDLCGEPVPNTVPLTPLKGYDDVDGCVGGGPVTRQEHFMIVNVPFQYAVPVLTGWELTYDCQSDHHVEKIGVRITDFHYDRRWRTLSYTIESTLGDDPFFDPTTGGGVSVRVDVLGLQPTTLPPTPTVSSGSSAVLAEPALNVP
jgi:hypothetical protein